MASIPVVGPPRWRRQAQLAAPAAQVCTSGISSHNRVLFVEVWIGGIAYPPPSAPSALSPGIPDAPRANKQVAALAVTKPNQGFLVFNHGIQIADAPIIAE